MSKSLRYPSLSVVWRIRAVSFVVTELAQHFQMNMYRITNLLLPLYIVFIIDPYFDINFRIYKFNFIISQILDFFYFYITKKISPKKIYFAISQNQICFVISRFRSFYIKKEENPEFEISQKKKKERKKHFFISQNCEFIEKSAPL